ncbi:MAG: hypothetical protein WC055_00800 [Melioribacteraceae bacterium]
MYENFGDLKEALIILDELIASLHTRCMVIEDDPSERTIRAKATRDAYEFCRNLLLNLNKINASKNE